MERMMDTMIPAGYFHLDDTNTECEDREHCTQPFHVLAGGGNVTVGAADW